MMSWRLLIAWAGAALCSACGPAPVPTPTPASVESRAIELARLTWSGAEPEFSEWFASGVEDTQLVLQFGGPHDLAVHSRLRSQREGGVKAIEVVSSEKLPNGKITLSMRTTFQSGQIAESRETWQLIDGKWRIALPEYDEWTP
jgi:hypothetical protein